MQPLQAVDISVAAEIRIAERFDERDTSVLGQDLDKRADVIVVRIRRGFASVVHPQRFAEDDAASGSVSDDSTDDRAHIAENRLRFRLRVDVLFFTDRHILRLVVQAERDDVQVFRILCKQSRKSCGIRPPCACCQAALCKRCDGDSVQASHNSRIGNLRVFSIRDIIRIIPLAVRFVVQIACGKAVAAAADRFKERDARCSCQLVGDRRNSAE